MVELSFESSEMSRLVCMNINLNMNIVDKAAKKLKIEPQNLRKYQADILQDLYRSWADNKKRTIIQLPTGAGKTHLFAQLANEFARKQERVLVLCHRLELIEQAKEKISSICSVDIGIVKSGVKPNFDAQIQIASVQSLPKQLDKLGNFGLLIVDECHHSTSRTWERIITHFSDTYIVGLTATPTRLDGGGFAHLFDNLVGNISIESLINDGYLSRYKLYASPIEMDATGCSKQGGDYKVADVEKKNNVIELAGHLIESYSRLAAGLPSVVFAVSIAHSIEIAARYNAAGIKATHLDGTTPTRDRIQALEDFKSGRLQVICNCDLFDEGVDIPSIGCIQVARPTKSLTKYLQMLGRGFRPSSGKEYVVFIDHTHNYRAHGLPDEIREWSLTGLRGERKKIGKTTQGQIVKINPYNCEIVENVLIDLDEVKSKYLDLPIDKIIADYQAGLSALKLGEKYKCSDGTIVSTLKKAGVYISKSNNKGRRVDVEANDIIADYNEGMTVAAIGRKRGITTALVSCRLKSSGVEILIHPQEKNLPDDEILADYQLGISPFAISKKYNTSRRSIATRLARMGIKPVDTRKNNLPIDNIIAAYSKGASPGKIAAEYGVGISTVVRRLKEAGVTKREKSDE